MTFVTHIPSLETSKAVFEHATEKQMKIRAMKNVYIYVVIKKWFWD